MRIRKLWTALALVFVTGLAVHSAGAQAKSATKTDTTKKATATKTAPKSAAVTPAGAAATTAKTAPATKTASAKSSPKTASGATAQKTASGTKVAGKPADASGKCKDGSFTKAATKQGACSSHGGVSEWYKG